jgi:hypothetical protein
MNQMKITMKNNIEFFIKPRLDLVERVEYEEVRKIEQKVFVCKNKVQNASSVSSKDDRYDNEVLTKEEFLIKKKKILETKN